MISSAGPPRLHARYGGASRTVEWDALPLLRGSSVSGQGRAPYRHIRSDSVIVDTNCGRSESLDYRNLEHTSEINKQLNETLTISAAKRCQTCRHESGILCGRTKTAARGDKSRSIVLCSIQSPNGSILVTLGSSGHYVEQHTRYDKCSGRQVHTTTFHRASSGVGLLNPDGILSAMSTKSVNQQHATKLACWIAAALRYELQQKRI